MHIVFLISKHFLDSGGNGSPVHSSSSGHSDTEPASPVQTEVSTAYPSPVVFSVVWWWVSFLQSRTCHVWICKLCGWGSVFSYLTANNPELLACCAANQIFRWQSSQVKVLSIALGTVVWSGNNVVCTVCLLHLSVAFSEMIHKQYILWLRVENNVLHFPTSDWIPSCQLNGNVMQLDKGILCSVFSVQWK